MAAEPAQIPVAALDAPLATRLKAVADELRLTVLQVLGQSSFGVLELCEILDVRQSGLSHHLKVLARAGWVETRREGNAIFYRRALPGLDDALHTALLEQVDTAPLPAAVARRLEAVQDRRAQRSRDYFARLRDGTPGTARELIADYPQYAEVSEQLLRRAQPGGGELAVEIGPGDGRFLAAMAPHYRQLVGYDSAPAMLEAARNQLAAHGVENVALECGEWPGVAPDEAAADALVLNMVLHHMPAPADSLRAAARRLKVGGVMLVTELCEHDQHWAHESCGDLWLGFDEQELLAWAARAGLESLECQYLAQRNGFQVQVRTFVRTGER